MAKEISPEMQMLMRQGGPLREQLEVQFSTGRATHEVHAIVALSDSIVALRRERDSWQQACYRLQNALENVRLLAARHRTEEWAGHMLRFCADAGVTGSPLRKEEK